MDNDKLKIANEYWKSCNLAKQQFIDNVIFTTIDMCEEITNKSIAKEIFSESGQFKRFRWELIYHILNHEVYNFNKKIWEKI